MILSKYELDCNMKCEYCYQNKNRATLLKIGKDFDAFKNTIRRLKMEMPHNDISLHGGECLLIPIPQLTELLELCQELEGKTTLVTNGSLITNEHIELFKRFNTKVTVSCDGRSTLNQLRGFTGVGMTLAYTSKLEETCIKMAKEGIDVKFIMTFNKWNQYHIDEIINWIVHLGNHGIIGGRINPIGGPYAASPERYFELCKRLFTTLMLRPGLHWKPGIDIMDAFLSGVITDCSHRPCDPFCTAGAHSVLPDGSVSSCLLSQMNMLHLQRLDTPIYLREHVLKNLDQKDGGCKDCRYWTMCYGGCNSITVDWRTKTSMCTMFKKFFKYVEEYIKSLGIEVKIPEEIDVSIEGPVHRVVPKRIPNGEYSDTIINGIRVIDTPTQVEVIYNG